MSDQFSEYAKVYFSNGFKKRCSCVSKSKKKMNIFVNAQSDFVTQYSVKWLLYMEILNNLICVTLTNGMYTRERQISTWRTQSLLLCKATSCFAGRSPLKILTQNPVNSFCVSPANQCSCVLLDNSLLKESLYTLTEKTRWNAVIIRTC